MPGEFRHQCRERRRTVHGQKAVGVVFNDRQFEAPGHVRDCHAPGRRDGNRGGVLQGRVQIQRFGLQFHAGLRQGFRIDPFVIHRQPDQADAELCRDGARAGIGDAFREQGIAGFGEHAENRQ
jgi:hypothetical protein